jgi:hypothetical protein
MAQQRPFGPNWQTQWSADVLRPFSFVDAKGITTGEIQDRVARETAAGTLDFYTRVIVDQASLGLVDNIIRTGFAGFATDVDYRFDSIGLLHPGTAARDLDPAGNAVGFGFLRTVLLTAGTDSVFFFVKINAVNFDANGTIDVSGETGDAFIQGFEPTSVSEPASLALGSGLFLLGAWARRKRSSRE